MDHYDANCQKEREAFRIAADKIASRGLDMRLVSAEYTFDNRKIVFFLQRMDESISANWSKTSQRFSAPGSNCARLECAMKRGWSVASGFAAVSCAAALS